MTYQPRHPSPATQALHDEPHALSIALLDLDRLAPADWHTRYGAHLRETLLDLAMHSGLVDPNDYDELEKEMVEAEQRVSLLDDATTDAAQALKRIVRQLDDIGVEDTLTDADRKAFESLTSQIEDIANELEHV
jgi:hypothetical protein